MNDAFYANLNQMAVMFSFMVAGYVLRKLRLLPENAGTVFAKLESYLLVPALSLNSFMNNCTLQNLSLNSTSVLFSGLALLMALLASFLLTPLFKTRGYETRVYRYGTAFGNAGYVGNAVVVAVFGEMMLFNYLMFTILISAVINTWGLYILVPPEEGKGKIDFKNIFNPIFVGILIGAALGLSGTTKYVPSFVTTAIKGAADCMGPVAMVLTGFIIGGFSFKKLIVKGKVYILAALRLIVIPTVMILVLKLFGAPDIAIIGTFFAFGTPIGLNTVVFPAAYGGDVSVGASMALISHVLAVITIPVMYSLLVV